MTSKKCGTGWPSAPTSGSAVSAQRVAKKKKATQPTPNKFQNDGSFMEKFKKIAEQKQQQQADWDQTEASSSTSATQKESYVENDCLPATTYLAPQTITYKSGSGEDKMALKRPQQVTTILRDLCLGFFLPMSQFETSIYIVVIVMSNGGDITFDSTFFVCS